MKLDDETVRQVADDLCFLLSVARGTKVQWITEEKLDGSGQVLQRTHGARITKPFTPLAPIHPWLVPKLCDFLEQTYPRYVARREEYRLNKGTIDAVLDARVETDFLEMRAAKLAIALETFKSNVMSVRFPEDQFVIDRDQFSQAEAGVRDVLIKELRGSGVSKRHANEMSQKTLCLNRRSFGSLLRRLAKDLEVRVSHQELQRFIHCRNALVHRGRFTEDAQSAASRRRSNYGNYAFMLDVMDRFLLRLLDYRGPYAVGNAEGGAEQRQI
ncbi:hypothetical protein [Candidatus Palauibacter sp.]|uniref:hypothetical protein n=1 Tax=Candidatus Palauibacter sp. TaxID=3101350 RepID=UPI003B520424